MAKTINVNGVDVNVTDLNDDHLHQHVIYDGNIEGELISYAHKESATVINIRDANGDATSYTIPTSSGSPPIFH